MPDQFKDYYVGTADWRGTLRSNNLRTYIVIILFFLIYASIGLLVDMYMATVYYPHATIPQLLEALITFRIFPLVTLIMVAIAAVSLMVCYVFYDRLMLLGTDYYEITPTTARNLTEQQLYNVVEEMIIAAGFRYMPRVFVIDADYMNAFASGYSQKSAMIAITRGLMSKLNRDELQAVMAHELSHIRHLDIKLTLTATLLANLSVMALDMLFYNMIFSNRRNSDSRSGNILVTIIIMLRYLLPIISILLLLYLSRKRELMADAGSVELMRTNQPLASALMKISDDHARNRDQYSEEYQRTPHENIRRDSYIFDPQQAGISSSFAMSDFFSTHPSLGARLAALGIRRRS